MTLTDELRGLETPEPAPDLSRAIMARIERLDENRLRESVSGTVAAHKRHPVSVLALPATLAALAIGTMLIVFSGVMASTFGPIGRSLAVAMPHVPSATLGPVALVAGVLVYVVGLSLSVAGRTDARARV